MITQTSLVLAAEGEEAVPEPAAAEAEAAKTCFAAEFKTSQVFTTQHTATARIV